MNADVATTDEAALRWIAAQLATAPALDDERAARISRLLWVERGNQARAS